MKLQSIEELEWSPVVANNSMNRDRIANGVNSYEQSVKIDPIQFIEARKHQSSIHWTDLCCGSGNALIQAARHFTGSEIADRLTLEGIDLVDFFSPAVAVDFLTFQQQNLNYWQPNRQYDLITIVHGLHYVGDKIDLLRKAAATLKKNGCLLANLDLNNIKINGVKDSSKELTSFFQHSNIHYNRRTKILRIDGPIKFQDCYKYLGATDQAGPNYTGQEAVHSFYAAKNI